VICALETLQRYNILYRDLKPENIMLDKTGNIKLIDFGFARVLHRNQDFRSSTNCGTLGYTAPEVLIG
jgi:serine/threonine protein kinase